MANAIDIRIVGDKALLKRFAKMPDAVQKKIARKGMREGGKIVKARFTTRIRSNK